MGWFVCGLRPIVLFALCVVLWLGFDLRCAGLLLIYVFACVRVFVEFD